MACRSLRLADKAQTLEIINVGISFLVSLWWLLMGIFSRPRVDVRTFHLQVWQCSNNSSGQRRFYQILW